MGVTITVTTSVTTSQQGDFPRAAYRLHRGQRSMDERASFGLWLRQRRQDLKLTQEDLAERMACSSSMVRKIEAGERVASQQMAGLLAESFAVVPGERAAFVQFAQGRLNSNVIERALWQTLHTHTHTVQVNPTNLTAPLTALIGREQELERLHNFLRLHTERLFTLTGPPGIGKTRLSLEVGIGLLDHFDDGVFFVSLAPISDPDLVSAAIAQTLGVKEVGSRPLAEQLTLFLRDKRQLLVLDNFEHVVEAAPFVASLLSSCPHLKVLVTSRETLHVHGEQQFPVPPLAVPDPVETRDVQTLAKYPSIALYVQRAQAVKPDFALNEDNAEAVAAICALLDGLPLAIELAAARINLLSPQEMLGRLDSRLKLLSGSARDVPPRQQTLRGAIDWSYNLLDKGEQTLFTRLGAFSGGCTFSAAEAVCNATGDLPMEMLDGLASLINKSLLRREQVSGESRVSMLEMIREYASERLGESGDAQTIRRLHTEYYLALAEASELELRGPEQIQWLEQLKTEQGNLRAAMEWSRETEDAAELGLRLAGALSGFWIMSGQPSEGRTRTTRVLSHPQASKRTATRAKALYTLGRLAERQGDHAASHGPLEASLDIAREAGDKQVVALVLSALATGMMEEGHSDYGRIKALFEESLAIHRESENKQGVAQCFHNLGHLASLHGDYEYARQLNEQGLVVRQEMGDTWGIAYSYQCLAHIAYDVGDYDRARWLNEQSLVLRRHFGEEACIAYCLMQLGEVHCAQEQPALAARLFGAADHFFEVVGVLMDKADKNRYEHSVAEACRQLGHEEFETLRAQGRAMTLDESVAQALLTVDLTG
jgi:predicted ATPase/transcriptional regulator with XRE-family HTH domain